MREGGGGSGRARLRLSLDFQEDGEAFARNREDFYELIRGAVIRGFCSKLLSASLRWERACARVTCYACFTYHV